MENDCKTEGREPKHIILRNAINRLNGAVNTAEQLLYDIIPPRPTTQEAVLEPKSVVEDVPVFQEVYDDAPKRIFGQCERLENIIAELREVLL